jgi:hypothetical protein
MWDLWWTVWHWDRFFSESFGFPLSISFHRYSIIIHSSRVRIMDPLAPQFHRNTVSARHNNKKYKSPNVLKTVKCTRIRWTGNVVRTRLAECWWGNFFGNVDLEERERVGGRFIASPPVSDISAQGSPSVPRRSDL